MSRLIFTITQARLYAGDVPGDEGTRLCFEGHGARRQVVEDERTVGLEAVACVILVEGKGNVRSSLLESLGRRLDLQCGVMAGSEALDDDGRGTGTRRLSIDYGMPKEDFSLLLSMVKNGRVPKTVEIWVDATQWDGRLKRLKAPWYGVNIGNIALVGLGYEVVITGAE